MRYAKQTADAIANALIRALEWLEMGLKRAWNELDMGLDWLSNVRRTGQA